MKPPTVFIRWVLENRLRPLECESNNVATFRPPAAEPWRDRGAMQPLDRDSAQFRRDAAAMRA